MSTEEVKFVAENNKEQPLLPKIGQLTLTQTVALKSIIKQEEEIRKTKSSVVREILMSNGCPETYLLQLVDVDSGLVQFIPPQKTTEQSK